MLTSLKAVKFKRISFVLNSMQGGICLSQSHTSQSVYVSANQHHESPAFINSVNFHTFPFSKREKKEK